jgi:hypothetical protein
MGAVVDGLRFRFTLVTAGKCFQCLLNRAMNIKK